MPCALTPLLEMSKYISEGNINSLFVYKMEISSAVRDFAPRIHDRLTINGLMLST
jgi:hypothetical protein